jgi:hypothetical protein
MVKKIIIAVVAAILVVLSAYFIPKWIFNEVSYADKISISEFQTRFNQELKEVGISEEINIEEMNRDGDTYKGYLINDLRILIAVDASNNVSVAGLSFFNQTLDADKVDKINKAILRTVSPGISDEDISKIIAEVQDLSGDDGSGVQGSEDYVYRGISSSKSVNDVETYYLFGIITEE